MADLTITVANVKPSGKTTKVTQVQIGEAVDEGEPVYLKTSDSKYWLTDADASAAASTAKGIAMTSGIADDYIYIVQNGPMDVGATLTKGEAYYVSDTPGGIKPHADLGVGDYITLLGHATATDTLEVSIKAYQVAL